MSSFGYFHHRKLNTIGTPKAISVCEFISLNIISHLNYNCKMNFKHFHILTQCLHIAFFRTSLLADPCLKVHENSVITYPYDAVPGDTYLLTPSEYKPL